MSAGYKAVHMTRAMFLNISVTKGHIIKCQAPGLTFKETWKLLFCLNFRGSYVINSDYTLDNNITEVQPEYCPPPTPI
ncbi:hypothetical protein E2C01_078667 [Portunus trituberculatus]|uniref:Uncharacterized protein n=1 Tax=Portunus trituberculatus TaxID=210409 RepID=A0A5B7IUQ6_PORTR|nr:hypothetical protein [Portunus trituberculatus]